MALEFGLGSHLYQGNGGGDEATLATFLRDPKGLVVGTKMSFHGLKKDEELQALLTYLATFDKNGMGPE